MGKRYFCDYCNRTFLDDPDSRKLHLKGTSHIRARNNHYKNFKDLKTIYQEESAKEACKRFMRYNQCQFNENCHHTHYSKEDLAFIKQKIDDNESQNHSLALIQEASLESWLKKKKSNEKSSTHANTSETTHQPAVIESSMNIDPSVKNLPLSMQPTSEEHLYQLEFVEWG